MMTAARAENQHLLTVAVQDAEGELSEHKLSVKRSWTWNR